MSRYYDLTLSDPKTNNVIRRWTSHPNGTNQPRDPGALDIEFDLLVTDYGTPQGSNTSTITLHGVALADITQAQSFTGLVLTLKGGMQAGLPLASPKQAGLLLVGQVFQSFGNWVGTEMTLDFVVSGSPYTLDAPGNFSLAWPAGQPLTVGIPQVLTQAYPNVKQAIQINENLVFPNDEYHTCSTLREFAQFVQGLTVGFLDTDYPGVSITIQGDEFLVYDGSATAVTVRLAFTDFVGQPTWIDQNVMQVKTVLRSDIQLSNAVLMPQGLQNLPGVVATSPASYPSQSKYQSAFQGKFTVAEMRHIGSFRSSDAAQWATVLNCAVI